MVFIILVDFPGAWYFYVIEFALEAERYKAMEEQHSNITDSIAYAADYLTDIHFNQRWTYNNCTK